MPRTKAAVKMHETYLKEDESESFQGKDLTAILRDLESLQERTANDIIRHNQRRKECIERYFYRVKSQVGRSFLDMTVKQFHTFVGSTEEKEGGVQKLLEFKGSVKKDIVRSGSRCSRKRSTSCQGRKAKSTGRKRASSTDAGLPIKCSKFLTPANRGIPSMPVVTPKVNPNIPMSVLRRPHQGECALSLAGSPLLVSGMTSDTMASVSVPLSDGRVIAILPTEGIEGATLNLDPQMRQQLQKLHNNLAKCLENA